MRRALVVLVAAEAVLLGLVGPVPAQASVTVLSGSVTLGATTVQAGGVLEFDPTADTTVEITGSLVVYGTLRMHPADASVDHVLRFVGVDETSYVGGGDGVTPGDVGLWVEGQGVLDAQGTPRAGWNRTGTDPTWRAGDEIRVAPTKVGDYTSFAPFTPGSPVPTVTSPSGHTYAAEVMNLTRNVRIEGTPGGKAHVRFHTSVPQTVRYVQVRWMGPQQGDAGKPVTGRGAWHVHRNDDGMRGSLFEGMVVRDAYGEFGFELHRSNGITIRDSIVYGGANEGFGWDSIAQSDADETTSDTLLEHDLAANIAPSYRSVRHAGFVLSAGQHNVIRDSAAVGIRAGADASGFHWPEGAGSAGGSAIWDSTDLVAHNNKADGVFVWQNTSSEDNDLVRIVAYRNGDTGINHGAYSNPYHYVDPDSFGNGKFDLVMHAKSKEASVARPLAILGGYVGRVEFPQHNKAEPVPPALITARVDSLRFDENEKKQPGRYDLIGTGLTRTAVVRNVVHSRTVVRVRDGADCWQITKAAVATIPCWTP